ncbi:hypothetical protein PGTUg99_018409 [Puccinia graminis f. sp. tritici]|uniref:Secreted protein n=1 Tax=Puccinia graminis f. sp. tritici TaxID=56615 RepID=A0A5B0RB06_PUCGR|nr:hypothetical protein PGTUg99_018409 [Puccinia graminis f. sp. tritici]
MHCMLLHPSLVIWAIAVGRATSKDHPNYLFDCSHQTVRSQPATVPFCGHPLFEDPKEPNRATAFTFLPAQADKSSPNHFKCLGSPTTRNYCCLPNQIKDNPRHYQLSKAVGGHCVRITHHSEKLTVVDLPQ